MPPRQPLEPLPLKPYALGMLAASCLAVVLAVFIAANLGGDRGVQIAVGSVIVLASVFTLVPLVGRSFIAPEMQGLVILGLSMGRTLVAMGGLMYLVEAQGLPRKPVVMGVLAGALVLLMAEATIAVILLQRREKRRASKSHKPPAAEPVIGTEPALSRSR